MVNKDKTLKRAENQWVSLTQTLSSQWREKGWIGEEAFFCMIRHLITVSVELIPIRRRLDSSVEILFLDRGEDSFEEFAHKLHTPGGKLVVPGDTVESVIAKIIDKEIGCPCSQLTTMPWAVGGSTRGYEVLLPVLVEVEGEPVNGEWINIDDVKIMASKDRIILVQYNAFLASAIEYLRV